MTFARKRCGWSPVTHTNSFPFNRETIGLPLPVQHISGFLSSTKIARAFSSFSSTPESRRISRRISEQEQRVEERTSKKKAVFTLKPTLRRSHKFKPHRPAAVHNFALGVSNSSGAGHPRNASSSRFRHA